MDLLLVLGIVFNLPVGVIAYRKKTLTVPGGIIAAGTVGFILFLVNPLFWFLLLTFFGTSTLLTRYKARDPAKLDALSLAEKGGQRDSFQVLANSGPALVLALIGTLTESLPVMDLVSWYGVSIAIAFAVVNADTWATELGVTSTSDPYWILNPTKRVPRGTSGGISPIGLIASILASSTIALVYAIGLIIANQFQVIPIILIILAGLLGSILDSFLGATIQAQYHCPSCGKLTEQSPHLKCDTNTSLQQGLSWFSNDMVNLVSTLLVIVLVIPFFW